MLEEQDSIFQKPKRPNLFREGVLRLRSLFLPSEGLHIGENRLIVKKDSAGAQQLYFQRQDGTEEAVTMAASEVKTVRKVSVSDSSTRVTVLTPTSGKKVRIVSCQTNSNTATDFTAEVYFGTGANITSNAGSEIMDSGHEDVQEHTHAMIWPTGGGPVGAADEVVSMRTGADVTAGLVVTICYREE